MDRIVKRHLQMVAGFNDAFSLMIKAKTPCAAIPHRA
jgi:hypothetical protein